MMKVTFVVVKRSRILIINYYRAPYLTWSLKCQEEEKLQRLKKIIIISCCGSVLTWTWKGLSYEMDFENVAKNWQILASIRAAAGFWIFRRHLWFLLKLNLFFPVNAKITPTAYVVRLILYLNSRQAFLTNAVSFYEEPIRGSVYFVWANSSRALTNIRAPGELLLSVGLLFAHQ
jgi:hypothetical protein